MKSVPPFNFPSPLKTHQQKQLKRNFASITTHYSSDIKREGKDIQSGARTASQPNTHRPLPPSFGPSITSYCLLISSVIVSNSPHSSHITTYLPPPSSLSRAPPHQATRNLQRTATHRKPSSPLLVLCIPNRHRFQQLKAQKCQRTRTMRIEDQHPQYPRVVLSNCTAVRNNDTHEGRPRTRPTANE